MVNAEKIVPAPGITVHTDKHGVTREYREVKRKAQVGELVKAVEPKKFLSSYTVGEIITVTTEDDGDDSVTDGRSGGWLWEEQYVVLEPTDIIHYDGKRWRDVKRKARVGELINMFDHHHTPVQGIRLVTSIDPEADSVHFWVDGTRFGTPYIRSGQSKPCYTVLEPADQPPATVAERIDALEKRVSHLSAEVAHLRRVVAVRVTANSVADRNDGAIQKMTDVFGDMFKPNTLTPQLTRADVIELAKKDVEELVFHGKDDRIDNFDVLQGSRFYGRFYTVDFRVDRPKRTVVALISDGTRNKRKPDAIGKSKSAPDDCFNVHIGKAIALRRALGLDVPDYYVNAPKPTEAKVGDIVNYGSYSNYVVTRKWDGESLGLKSLNYDYVYSHWSGKPHRIIDDSHDFGGEGQ